MTWNDIENILFDGTPEEISAVRCPEWGSMFKYEFFQETNSIEIMCENCGTMIRGSGCDKIPNFAIKSD